MKDMIKKSLLSTLLVGGLFTSNLMAMDNKSFENLQVFKDVKAKVTGHKLIAKKLDMYLVKGKDGQGRPFEIIMDKDGNYMILSSNVIDVNKGKQIKIPLDMSLLKGKEAFTYGSGSKHYYVFTDPQCPYCVRFKNTWADIQKDVTLHVYFYNLSSHTKANEMTRWVMDGKTNQDKIDRYYKVTSGDKSYQNANLPKAKVDKYNETIIMQKELGESLGVQGVPAVIDTNGESIPWPALKPKK